MPRPTGRPLRHFTIEDSRNAVLSREMTALIGAAGNGSDQGNWVVAARTKVDAAARATEVIGQTFRPQQFSAAAGNDATAVINAGLLQRNGDLVAWRRSGADNVVVRTVDPTAGTAVETVAHWRHDRNNLNLVRVEHDVTLMDVTPVPVSPEVGREQTGADIYGRTKILFAGGVATHAAWDGEVWVPGLGRVRAERARELMSGLAGALAELEARP